MNGFLILDKPAGLTSHDCCEEVKKILKVKKTGHAGTLDIGVTGILVIAINEALKIMPLLERLNKKYVGEALLHEEISEETLKEGIKKFIGKIKQLPPVRSRVKRQIREREIYEFKLLEKRGKTFSFSVYCEAGTYIRKLIHDLGQSLGINANMSKLRRIEQGPFFEKDSIILDRLTEKNVLSIEDVVKRLKINSIQLNEEEEKQLRQGKFLEKEAKEGLFVGLNYTHQVFVLLIKKDNFIKPERILNI
jgi:H/ACA ribonucleoprotein complex subunit 4